MTEATTQYVLRKGESYYRMMTAIGPAFTNDPSQAMRFNSMTEAVMESTTHIFAFVGYEPEPVGSEESEGEG